MMLHVCQGSGGCGLMAERLFLTVLARHFRWFRECRILSWWSRFKEVARWWWSSFIFM